MSDTPDPAVPTDAPAPAEPAPAGAVATLEPPTAAPSAAEPVAEGSVPAAAPVAGASPAADPAPSTPAVADPSARRSVQVPVWLLAAVVGLVLVVGAFLVGRETAPGSGESGPATLSEAVEMTASGEMELGDFDARALLDALRQNDDFDLGIIGEILEGVGGR